MVEVLIAYLLHHGKYVLKVPSLQGMMDPLSAISAEQYNIPLPVYEYICGIGPAITPTGDKVFWNLPDIAVPRNETISHDTLCRSGTFGPPTVETHNVYEAYFSPFISSEYVIRMAEVGHADFEPIWRPFPVGWINERLVPTENLLGYRPLERQHLDALNKCRECTFDESDTVTGRLCHSAYALNLTSGVIGRMSSIKIVKADFKPKENDAAFIYKLSDELQDILTPLWDEPATLKAPYAFSVSAANKAQYFAYKRQRSWDAPGYSFVYESDDDDNPIAPPHWIDTINVNFNCELEFALQRGFRDRPSLRAPDHEEEEGLGTVTQDIYTWLDATFIKKT